MSTSDTRRIVVDRDKVCAATFLDPNSGNCYDKWGQRLNGAKPLPWDVGEMDFVRLESHGPRHTLSTDHVWLCPGHHRGTGPSAGYVWATSHRREERNYLEQL